MEHDKENKLREEYAEWYSRANPELAPHQTKYLIADWFLSKRKEELSELRKQLIQEIMNHKFNTFKATTALFIGNDKLSTIKEDTVIDAQEIISYLQSLLEEDNQESK